MKYYYIRPSTNSYDIFGSSKLGISPQNEGFKFDTEAFWNYNKPIQVTIKGEEQASKLGFLYYQYWHSYIGCMIPELKSVLEQFNMPSHRWYKAQAGYNLDFVDRMKKYFNIDYAIDINEKRDYWILQLLRSDRIKELDYSSISFDIVNFDTQENVGFVEKGQITSYEQYVAYTEGEYEKRKCVLHIREYIYRKNYDILWGGTQIVFNEKVKMALESTGLITAENGLEFAEFTSYQIEMLGEQS